MAGHVVNPNNKFEDPMTIRSLVMSSDISHIGYHWQCVAATAHAPYHMTYV